MRKALAVVAHFDDHAIWMNTAIERLRDAGWDWTLVALCEPENWPRARRDYFYRYCDRYGVTPHLFGFRNDQGGEVFSDASREEMASAVLRSTRDACYDAVFTHSRQPEGEYGRHRSHVEACNVTEHLASSGALGTSQPIFFCYHAIYPPGCPTVADERRNSVRKLYVPLTYPELARKARICSAITVADDLGGIGYPCPSPECFETDGDVPPELKASWQ